MDYYGSNIQRLIEALKVLPGVGTKSAQRMAFHITAMPEEEVRALADAITNARKNVHFCKVCQTVTDDEICPICRSKRRDHRQIMVVETSRDLAAYEKTGHYEGVYHVLHGSISPMLGIGPNDIRLKELLTRLQNLDEEKADEGSMTESELIVATSATVEGESTAMYILKLVKTLELPIKVTRIASGVPVGGDIENIDEVTLERALRGRTELK
ncbi:MAG: recombination mediator RecR [Lachnospiraceae bacterium]|nr:recombination mediator RecR [Lachnospiraceae bacterium]